MTTIRNYLAMRGIEMPSENIRGDWFVENGLRMFVSCACCGRMLALPMAWVDDDEYLYCDDCAGAVND